MDSFSFALDGSRLRALGPRPIYIGVGCWGAVGWRVFDVKESPIPDGTTITDIECESPSAATVLFNRLKLVGLEASQQVMGPMLLNVEGVERIVDSGESHVCEKCQLPIEKKPGPGRRPKFHTECRPVKVEAVVDEVVVEATVESPTTPPTTITVKDAADLLP